MPCDEKARDGPNRDERINSVFASEREIKQPSPEKKKK
jgi:hypothetical protein